MEITTKRTTRHGVQDSAFEARSYNQPRDVYDLHGRSSITPKFPNQKGQANSSLVDALQSNGLEHLSRNEKDILERQLSMPPVKVSYTMLYRYATKTDIFILIVSAICAIASGAVMPLMTVRTIVG
jgi:ATP-binding cassette subfamily B (MDR/TAP) protein 1